jgi:hypothetical protein
MMPRPILPCFPSEGTEIHVMGMVAKMYDTNGIGALIPVEFTQVDEDTVLLHYQPHGKVYLKYKKEKNQ